MLTVQLLWNYKYSKKIRLNLLLLPPPPGKGKFVPVLAIKAYGVTRHFQLRYYIKMFVDHHILAVLLPDQQPLLPTEYKVGWAQEPVWNF
jgi:hypothetical protein